MIEDKDGDTVGVRFSRFESTRSLILLLGVGFSLRRRLYRPSTISRTESVRHLDNELNDHILATTTAKDAGSKNSRRMLR